MPVHCVRLWSGVFCGLVLLLSPSLPAAADLPLPLALSVAPISDRQVSGVAALLNNRLGGAWSTSLVGSLIELQDPVGAWSAGVLLNHVTSTPASIADLGTSALIPMKPYDNVAIAVTHPLGNGLTLTLQGRNLVDDSPQHPSGPPLPTEVLLRLHLDF